MKKTLTINISGIIFNIDEDAYDVLNLYLNRVKTYFSGQEGGQEICDDIESRIAELLGLRISETKQVITVEDVKEVIAVMGDTADITGESDEGTRGRGDQGTRRLFRDPDQRILGGVCGGLGVYFRIDPVILRLVFVILIFSGFGIPVYLVLWIITPLAQTPSERLEMRGEPVTVKNIERSVKTEWTHVKGKINGLAAEAKDTYKRSTPALGILLENLGKACLVLLRVVWGIFRVVFGIILILVGLSLVFALMVLLFGWFGPAYTDGQDVIISLPVLVHTFVGAGVSTGLVMLTSLVFLGIPFLLLFYSGLRLAFRIKKIPYAGLTAFNIWLVSLFILLYLGFKVSNNFRTPQTLTHKDAVISSLAKDTLYLKLDTRLTDSLMNTNIVTALDDPGMFVTGNGTILLKPELSILPSDDSLFHLTRNVSSRGRSMEDAAEYCRSVRYQYAVRDSLVVFDPIAMLPGGEPWQSRKVRFRLEVPAGKIVVLDDAVYRILSRNVHDDRYSMKEKKYRMTPEGLEEIASEVIPESNK
jgi:phage shock protein PspC (stress-responsive transcriptional regulator)